MYLQVWYHILTLQRQSLSGLTAFFMWLDLQAIKKKAETKKGDGVVTCVEALRFSRALHPLPALGPPHTVNRDCYISF